MTVRILEGDCIEVMRTLPSDSIDAVVTDPPYGIRFMGKAWDGADIDRTHGLSSPDGAQRQRTGTAAAAAAGKYDLAPAAMRAFQEFSRVWAAEAFRVLKPGGHLLSFSSPRTFHRMTSGIEDAGFEIRDTIMWLFGSGFPKSHNGEWGGTALKPAHEPIVVARKPLIGTVEENWRAHGTGALKIDECRIDWPDGAPEIGTPGWGGPSKTLSAVPGVGGDTVARNPPSQLGRWPANVVHDGSDEVLAAFPDAVGQIADASSSSSRKNQLCYGEMRRGNGRDDEPSANSANSGDVGFKMRPGARRGDAGSAARFYYCAKASKADREAGCEGLPTRRGGMVSNTSGQHMTRRDGEQHQRPAHDAAGWWRARPTCESPSDGQADRVDALACAAGDATRWDGARPIPRQRQHSARGEHRGIRLHWDRARSGIRGDRQATGERRCAAIRRSRSQWQFRQHHDSQRLIF